MKIGDSMRRVIIMLSVIFASVGCATSTTGIVKISEDTYMLAKQNPNVWTEAEVKVEIYKEANAFCEKDGKKFTQISSTGNDSGINWSSAEVQFKCE